LTAADGTCRTEPLRQDTVTIDLDAQRVHLLWRIALPHEQGVQHMTIGVVPHAE